MSLKDIPELYRIKRLFTVNQYLTDALESLEIELEKHKAYIKYNYHFYGYGYWGIFEIKTNKLIGSCGLQNNEIDHNMETELGYLLDPLYQGKGFALECAQYVLKYAKENLALSRIAAVIHPDNRSSINLAKKLGLKKEKEILHQGIMCELFTITL